MPGANLDCKYCFLLIVSPLAPRWRWRAAWHRFTLPRRARPTFDWTGQPTRFGHHGAMAMRCGELCRMSDFGAFLRILLTWSSFSHLGHRLDGQDYDQRPSKARTRHQSGFAFCVCVCVCVCACGWLVCLSRSGRVGHGGYCCGCCGRVRHGHCCCNVVVVVVVVVMMGKSG